MIRIRLEEDLRSKALKDILKIIRKAILEAFMVRPLGSKDLDLHVKTQTTKDKLLNGPNLIGFKVLRKDYLLKILGVPLSIQIENGKHVNNK
jgi:hypothetical protein